MSDWDDLLTTSVDVEVWASQDEYGVVTYADAVSVQARVSGRLRVVTTPTGEERVSTVSVYLKDPIGVTVRDRVTLPAGWTPAQPPILAVGRCPDETGVIYETIYA